jgi:hypothetical protein
MQGRSRKYASALLTGLFFALCLLPGVLLFTFEGETRSLVENRDLAGLPSAPATVEALGTWTGEFDAFVADHFGGRKKLVAAYNYVHVLGGISPNPRVLIGRDGWFFLEQTFLKDSNRGAMPLSEQALADLLASFERRRAYLDSKGIGFAVLPLPDKNSIFPQYLPATVEFVGPSRLEQFRDACAHVRFICVDALAAVREATADGEETYFQTDSHWNSRGAWFAYRALMETLRDSGYRKGVLLEETDVEFIRLDPFYPTDIVRNLLGLQGWIPDDHGIRARVRDDSTYMAFRVSDGQPYEYLYAPPPGQEQKHFKREQPRDGSRVLVYRDSYGNAMLPFLVHSFDELVYVRPPKNMSFDPADIERHQPDLVIYEFVERALYYSPDNSLLNAAAPLELTTSEK